MAYDGGDVLEQVVARSDTGGVGQDDPQRRLGLQFGFQTVVVFADARLERAADEELLRPGHVSLPGGGGGRPAGRPGGGAASGRPARPRPAGGASPGSTRGGADRRPGSPGADCAPVPDAAGAPPSRPALPS